MEKVANDSIMRETLAEAKMLARRVRLWAGLLGAGRVIGLTGPLGTFDTLSL